MPLHGPQGTSRQNTSKDKKKESHIWYGHDRWNQMSLDAWIARSTVISTKVKGITRGPIAIGPCGTRLKTWFNRVICRSSLNRHGVLSFIWHPPSPPAASAARDELLPPPPPLPEVPQGKRWCAEGHTEVPRKNSKHQKINWNSWPRIWPTDELLR